MEFRTAHQDKWPHGVVIGSRTPPEFAFQTCYFLNMLYSNIHFSDNMPTYISGSSMEINSLTDVSFNLIYELRRLEKAKEEYIKVYPKKAEELKEWDNMTFLNKAKITRQGKITNAAIILVGKEESEHFISPAVCKIRWKLQSEDDKNKDFHIFSIPMIMAVDEITNTIRNTSYVYTIEEKIIGKNLSDKALINIQTTLKTQQENKNFQKTSQSQV